MHFGHDGPLSRGGLRRDVVTFSPEQVRERFTQLAGADALVSVYLGQSWQAVSIVLPTNDPERAVEQLQSIRRGEDAAAIRILTDEAEYLHYEQSMVERVHSPGSETKRMRIGTRLDMVRELLMSERSRFVDIVLPHIVERSLWARIRGDSQAQPAARMRP